MNLEIFISTENWFNIKRINNRLSDSFQKRAEYQLKGDDEHDEEE